MPILFFRLKNVYEISKYADISVLSIIVVKDVSIFSIINDISVFPETSNLKLYNFFVISSPLSIISFLNNITRDKSER